MGRSWKFESWCGSRVVRTPNFVCALQTFAGPRSQRRLVLEIMLDIVSRHQCTRRPLGGETVGID
jgi:hypothetical protein